MLNVERNEETSLFDIVVSDPDAVITLYLPDGRIVESTGAKVAGIDWKKLKDPTDIDPPGEMPFRISGLLLRDAGTHHVVAFNQTAAGTYRIRTDRPTQTSVAFIALARMFRDIDLTNISQLPPGEVGLQLYALPRQPYAGSEVPLHVRFIGDPVEPQITFEVRVEYKDKIVGKDWTDIKYTQPTVEHVPVTMSRTADRHWHGIVIPRQPGVFRVGFHASGRRTNGKTFSTEAVSGQVTVLPVVARFRSVSEKAVDTDGNGTLDRLDVTADLDVLKAGKYEMSIGFRGNPAVPFFRSDAIQLGTGSQTLTVSVAAKMILRWLEAGPWNLFPPVISRYREGERTDSVEVPPDVALKTRTYPHEKWDKGPIWGEEHVEAHGIRPAPSGRFRSVEVTWRVFTPGGDCYWRGELHTAGGPRIEMTAGGYLPPGKTMLGFVLDAASIANSPGKDWHFSPALECGGNDPTLEISILVDIDSSQYASSSASFHVISKVTPIIPVGQFQEIELVVPERRNGEVTFHPLEAPEGFHIRLMRPASGEIARTLVLIDIARAARPGRYFLPIEAVSGSERTSTEITVDVVPPRVRMPVPAASGHEPANTGAGMDTVPLQRRTPTR